MIDRNLKRDSVYERRVHSYIRRMSEEIGVDIPNGSYPVVLIDESNRASGYGVKENTIVIGRKFMNSGNAIGGEIAHFIRDITNPEPSYKKRRFIRDLGKSFQGMVPKEKFSEKYTGEFFDVLGKRILRKIAKPGDKLEFYNISLKSGKEYVKQLKELRKNRRGWEKYLQSDPDYYSDNSISGREQIKIGNEQKLDILEHARPYKFADALDLNRLRLQEVFDLPDVEIRKRFFREDPVYEFNSQVPEAKITRKKSSLEGKVITGIIAILGLSLGIIFSSSNFTGFVILNQNQNISNFTGIFFLIIGLICAFLFFKNRK